MKILFCPVLLLLLSVQALIAQVVSGVARVLHPGDDGLVAAGLEVLEGAANFSIWAMPAEVASGLR